MQQGTQEAAPPTQERPLPLRCVRPHITPNRLVMMATVVEPAMHFPSFLPSLAAYLYMYDDMIVYTPEYVYKVPLRDVPRGVAQERIEKHTARDIV